MVSRRATTAEWKSSEDGWRTGGDNRQGPEIKMRTGERRAELDYRMPSHRHDASCGVGSAFSRNAARQTDRPFRSTRGGVTRFPHQNGGTLADGILPVTMELADPQELSLHHDQAPDSEHPPHAISKELSQGAFCHYDVFASLPGCSLRPKRGTSNHFRHSRTI